MDRGPLKKGGTAALSSSGCQKTPRKHCWASQQCHPTFATFGDISPSHLLACYTNGMSTEATEQQGGPERRRSKEISLNRQRPPLDVPGYDPERCLGVGAYGEVWVAVERNTGRRVAIKFYTHSGGLDWSLLSREVEKLSFLFSDRYIVQLLSVGWNAEPPYYIMEYIERGSLAERLRQGPLAVEEAVGIFRGVAIGLVHAHDKGVLHCDLKPANILLDQDGHPRLADFGQSRLSHEQIPSWARSSTWRPNRRG